jgi:hypothetical protein
MKRGLAIFVMAAMGAACGGTVTGQGNGSGGGSPAGSSVGTGRGGGSTSGVGGSVSTVVERLAGGSVDKIDLLLVVDNSAGMADKQQLLALAVPDLIRGLVNPPCVDDITHAPVATQPATPVDTCPAGSSRLVPPILDMHVGLLSSSLGTFGADGCPDTPPMSCPTADTHPNDDHGLLVTRSDSCDSAGPIPTYQAQGFLAWDPTQKLTPPGIKDIGQIGTGGPGSGMGVVGALHDLVVGDGQNGCGFESQNESWYRFLVDPAPYQSIMLVNNQVQRSGVDAALLQQRKEFLRPDSLLAIVVLSDETDVSIKELSSYPLFAAPELHLPHARQECTTKGPLDPCCASCGQATPAGCLADPMCQSNPLYSAADENTELRAFGLISHKQRYGIEFMYQPSRYVTGLTSPTVPDVNGMMAPNAIYSNLDPANYAGAVRDPSLVFYAAIVGVPWQLIAWQNAMGMPDLVSGVSAIDKTKIGGFKTGKELELTDHVGNTFWDDIAGDPENYKPAKSPFMVESTGPRSGTDPITGIAISPTSTPNGLGNPLNDHEWTIPAPAGDIEYACIFPLMIPRDESNPGSAGDCVFGSQPDNPLCAPNPADNGKSSLQTKAKAYPGIKHLAIAHGLGNQGVVGSICPAQLTEATKADFGYRPAVGAILEAVRPALQAPCLPKPLTPNAQGQVACVIVEGTHAAPCTCDPTKARALVSPQNMHIVQAAQASPAGQGLTCFCEINQASGPALMDCQNSAAPTSNGWCYVDASEGAGAAQLVAHCPAGGQHEIRFVGAGAPGAGAVDFLACQ